MKAHENNKEEPREAEPVQTQRQLMTLRSKPRLSLLMGIPGRKEEATYDLWKYEVNCQLFQGFISQLNISHCKQVCWRSVIIFISYIVV